MATITRSLACLLALGALATARPAVADPGAPPSGKVLLLENGRILEGDIVRDGDRYRIRRSIGETSVPADTVVGLCADRAEAFERLRGRANLGDPDERLRLAKWGHLYGLREQALAEVA